MLYKDIKVEQVDVAIYLGEEYKDKNWKENERLVFDKLIESGLDNFGAECVGNDLVYIYTEEVTRVYMYARDLFSDVKINIYLDDYIEEDDGTTYNALDLTYEEYLALLNKQGKDIDVI